MVIKFKSSDEAITNQKVKSVIKFFKNLKSVKMKNVFNISISGVIALLAICSFTTRSMAQSTIMAEQYAYDAAKKMMSSYCPMSGTDAAAYVSKVEYNYSNDRYIIKMTATWYGKPCMLCSYGTFSIEGVLQVNENGSNASFNPIYKNSLVKDGEFYSNLTKGAVVLGVLAAASSK